MISAETTSSAADPDQLLRPAQAAAFLNFSLRALEAWRHRGDGPKYVRVSKRAVRYRRADLMEWARDRLVCNTAQTVVT
jgi:hypothetical protein